MKTSSLLAAFAVLTVAGTAAADPVDRFAQTGRPANDARVERPFKPSVERPAVERADRPVAERPVAERPVVARPDAAIARPGDDASRAAKPAAAPAAAKPEAKPTTARPAFLTNPGVAAGNPADSSAGEARAAGPSADSAARGNLRPFAINPFGDRALLKAFIDDFLKTYRNYQAGADVY